MLLARGRGCVCTQTAVFFTSVWTPGLSPGVTKRVQGDQQPSWPDMTGLDPATHVLIGWTMCLRTASPDRPPQFHSLGVEGTCSKLGVSQCGRGRGNGNRSNPRLHPELVEGRGPLEDKMDPRVKRGGDGLSASRSSEISPALRFPFRNICDNIWTALPEVLS